ncbi:MAG: zinc-binding alcohol dehydrogenase [Chloroflexi bacterium]|nr:zinc-binding alcohol dehydrogenase [Chloroflexota bacterium]
MKNTSIVFTGCDQVEVQELEENLEGLQAREVLVKTSFSLVSAGTELTCLAGIESWFSFPSTPGYTSVGEVVKVGDQVIEVAPGDEVYSWGGHKQYNRVNLARPGSMCIPVPAGITLPLVPFARMITIALTALRVSDIELGDDVAVIGLGLVGNFAAQLARLQGGNVIGLDHNPGRVALAADCGVRNAIVMENPSAAGKVAEITNQRGVGTLIEASGRPGALLDGLPLVGRYGEVILVGIVRGEYQANLSAVLDYVHLDTRGNVTFKGAHEWRIPVARDAFVKHSIQRNSEIALDLIRCGDLEVAPLLSHSLSPYEAPEAYHGLKNRKNEFIGVVFDWTAVPTTV